MSPIFDFYTSSPPSLLTIPNSALLEQAGKIFSRASYYARDLARVRFQTSQVLASMGRSEDATKELHAACDLRRRVVVGDLREAATLEEADFDELVVFWSV